MRSMSKFQDYKNTESVVYVFFPTGIISKEILEKEVWV